MCRGHTTVTKCSFIDTTHTQNATGRRIGDTYHMLGNPHGDNIFRPPGTLVPEGLMFYADVFFFRRATSELPRPIAVKLCHMIAIRVFFIMQVQKFGGPSLQRNWGPKHAKFRAISDNFRLRSRISPERVKISKIGKTYDHQRPRSTKKVW